MINGKLGPLYACFIDKDGCFYYSNTCCVEYSKGDTFLGLVEKDECYSLNGNWMLPGQFEEITVEKAVDAITQQTRLLNFYECIDMYESQNDGPSENNLHWLKVLKKKLNK